MESSEHHRCVGCVAPAPHQAAGVACTEHSRGIMIKVSWQRAAMRRARPSTAPSTTRPRHPKVDGSTVDTSRTRRIQDGIPSAQSSQAGASQERQHVEQQHKVSVAHSTPRAMPKGAAEISSPGGAAKNRYPPKVRCAQRFCRVRSHAIHGRWWRSFLRPMGALALQRSDLSATGYVSCIFHLTIQSCYSSR